MTEIKVVKGDITKFQVDAIVNAANKSLLGGGGVDGAIHAAAGPGLLEECKTLGGCQTGEAKITKGYDLPAKYVIHTVGPIYGRDPEKEAEHLQNCYLSSLELAKEKNLKTIAFPAICTGVYGYPKQEAADIAFGAVQEFIRENPDSLAEITFVLFDDENFKIYELLNWWGDKLKHGITI